MIKGGVSQSSVANQINGIRVNTTSYGAVVNLIYGMMSVSPDIVWYNDWVASSTTSNTKLENLMGQATTGGKKSGKFGPSPVYYSSAIDFLIGHAPIAGYLTAWYNNLKLFVRKSSVTGVVSNGQFSFVPSGGESKNQLRTTIPSTGPFTIQVPNFISDINIAYAPLIFGIGGLFLVRSDIALPPGPFQYTVTAEGLYTFNSTNAGLAILISYYQSIGLTSPLFLAGIWSVTLQETADITFNDYGGETVHVVRTSDRPLWNTYFPVPGRLDSGAYTARLPYIWWYDGTTPTINVPPDLNGGIITVHYGVPFLTNSKGEPFPGNSLYHPLGVLQLEAESSFGSGTEYTKHPEQQIVQNWVAGLGSPTFDFGLSNNVPNLNFETLGTFTYWPNGDAEVADVITDLVMSGPVLTGSGNTPFKTVVRQLTSLVTHVTFHMFAKYERTDDYVGAADAHFGPEGILTFVESVYLSGDRFTAQWKDIVVDGLKDEINAGHDLDLLFSIQGTLGPADGETLFTIYECYLSFECEDGSTGTLRPSAFHTVPNATGVITTPENIIDGDLTTSGSVERHHFSPLGDSPYIGLTGWVQLITVPDTASPDIIIIGHGCNCNNYDNGGYLAPLWAFGNGILLDDLTAMIDWCHANDVHVAMNIDAQRSAKDILDELFIVGNCAPVYSGGLLKAIPYDEVSGVGCGRIYIAPTASGPVAHLTDIDFLRENNAPPVEFARKRRANCDNIVSVEYIDRETDYARDIVSEIDERSVTLNGPRKGGTLGGIGDMGVRPPSGSKVINCITEDSIAQSIASILAKRSAAGLNEYTFTLKAERIYLEAMDLVEITDARLGLVNFPVRLIEVAETDKHGLKCKAVEFQYGLNHPDKFLTTKLDFISQSTGVSPGVVNPPIIFQPPNAMSNSISQIWIAVSGLDTAYGGCKGYLSLDGGLEYSINLGFIAKATMGVLTADFAIGADPDTVNHLSVDLSESLGSVASQSQEFADSGIGATYVEAATEYEIVIPTVVSLTGVNAYTYDTYIRRGGWASIIADHTTGKKFAVLDSTIFKMNVNETWLGKTLFFKFLAVNKSGTAVSTLADCTAYPYTITDLNVGSGQQFIIVQD